MISFIIRRLIVTIPTILIVITLTWGLIRLAPGNFYTGERPIPKAIENNIREKYGLNKPWYVQYGRMMGHILRLDAPEGFPGPRRHSPKTSRKKRVE